MKYVTPDDFKNSPFGGFDLRSALSNGFNDNESRNAEMFLELVTEHLMAWIEVKTFRNFDWNNLSPFQMKYWKEAIIAQAQYTYREGSKAFGLFSGVDDERGRLIDANTLNSVEVCNLCIELLTRGGLFNLNIKNRRRYWPWGSAGGFF